MQAISKQRKYEIKQRAKSGKLVVLSLFDGMSGAQIALKELGIVPAKYFASEVLKKAIRVASQNFAETEQVGDANKWSEWLPGILKENTIDLIICGLPCKNFSASRSKRWFVSNEQEPFFTALEILKFIENEQKKPFYFLFETVDGNEMLANYLRTNVIHIDNAVFDAAHRSRIYFTNICAKFDFNLFDEMYCYSTIPSLTDVRPRPFPFDKNPSGDLFLSEKQLAYYFKYQEPFEKGDKSPLLILKNETPNCITTRVDSRHGGNLVAMKCAKPNSYLGLGYSFRMLSISELKKCNGIPEWFDFGSYSYSSVYELIGNGFGIGSIKYVLNYIFK